MRLFYHPGTCALAPHILLAEGGFEDYALERVDINHRYSGGDFYLVNPKGYIPTLELDGGEILTEGAAILQHLADIAPTPGLIGAPGTIARARCVEWLTFVATELHKSFPPLWQPDVPADFRARMLDLLRRRIDYVEARLTDGPYLLGEGFSAADAYLFTVLRWADRIALDLGEWPNVTAFLARIAARPLAAQAIAAEEG